MLDYKKIIKSQETRFKILSMLKFIPDSAMVKFQYKIKLGRMPNIANPTRYSEKIQWYKLNYRKHLMAQCADKYGVREYIKAKGLDNILNRLYGVYNNAEEINFEDLPNKFVIKTTNGSGTNILCFDKKIICIEDIKEKLHKWIKRDNFASGREWAYRHIEPRIIIEEYLEDKENLFEGINDYKFLCFNGEVKYIVLDVNRQTNHKRNIYDADWRFINVETDCPNFGDCVQKPEGLDDMLSVAKILSEDFPCLRVDLYWVNKKVYFGELTFYPWSGYVLFQPDEFDFILGNEFKLPEVLI